MWRSNSRVKAGRTVVIMAYLMGLMIGERIRQRRMVQMDLKDASEASRGS